MKRKVSSSGSSTNAHFVVTRYKTINRVDYFNFVISGNACRTLSPLYTSVNLECINRLLKLGRTDTSWVVSSVTSDIGSRHAMVRNILVSVYVDNKGVDKLVCGGIKDLVNDIGTCLVGLGDNVTIHILNFDKQDECALKDVVEIGLKAVYD